MRERGLRHCLKHSAHAAVIPDLLVETGALLGGEAVKRLQQDEP